MGIGTDLERMIKAGRPCSFATDIYPHPIVGVPTEFDGLAFSLRNPIFVDEKNGAQISGEKAPSVLLIDELIGFREGIKMR